MVVGMSAVNIKKAKKKNEQNETVKKLKKKKNIEDVSRDHRVFTTGKLVFIVPVVVEDIYIKKILLFHANHCLIFIIYQLKTYLFFFLISK